MVLKALIVEDEPLSRIFLHNLLTEFCPQIEVIGKVATEDEAVEFVTTFQPQLVFLDIELQKGSGFEVLKRIDPPYPLIIFTTAFDHHAVRAIQFSGVHFLQKPIDIDHLQHAIRLFCEDGIHSGNSISISYLLQALERNFISTHIALPAGGQVSYAVVEEIVRVEANENESKCWLRSGVCIPTSRSIKEMEMLLADYSFFRVHQAHLININEVKAGSRIQDDVILNDGSRVPVSPRKKQELIDLI
jgi:two-component system LytT family response regulator